MLRHERAIVPEASNDNDGDNFNDDLLLCDVVHVCNDNTHHALIAWDKKGGIWYQSWSMRYVHCQ